MGVVRKVGDPNVHRTLLVMFVFIRNPRKHLTIGIELLYKKNPYLNNQMPGFKCFLVSTIS